MKRTTIVGIVLSFFLVVSMPFTTSVMILEQEKEPEYYEVIRYNMRGLTYDKETIRISYNDAMEMKQELDHLESLSLNQSEKNDRKNNVFEKHNLISNIEINHLSHFRKSDKISIFENKKETSESLFLLLFIIEGTIGISLVNLFNFIYIAPIFFSISKGINVEIEDLSGTFSFESNEWLHIIMLALFGVILVLPFISPGGYILAQGFAALINEL